MERRQPDEVNAAEATIRTRVLVLAVHPASVAATRLRALQYVSACRDAGLDLALWSFLHEEDLPCWFGPSQLRRGLILLRALVRLPSAVIAILRADVVIVQREALPIGPPLLELLAARTGRFVWDVDDAIWVEFTSPTAGRVPRWLRAPGQKHIRVCRAADEVWAGSGVLAEWCRQFNGEVHVLPTVVPVAQTPPRPPLTGSISWVGSHSTGPFVEAVLPALRDAGLGRAVEIVGAQVEAPEGLPVHVSPWSPAKEAEVLAGTRVGLYPVDRMHPLAEGKCGLKAILFMAHGIPPVVTPTTTNAVVVRDGVEGFHADSPDQWVDRVRRLLEDDSEWKAMSLAAHDRAREHFSLEAWSPFVVARLCALSGKQRSGAPVVADAQKEAG